VLVLLFCRHCRRDGRVFRETGLILKEKFVAHTQVHSRRIAYCMVVVMMLLVMVWEWLLGV